MSVVVAELVSVRQLKMAKVNTLFSYFSKTPSPKISKKNERKRSEVLSPHKNGNKMSGRGTSKPKPSKHGKLTVCC